MSEGEATQDTPKKRGWPKGKPRKPQNVTVRVVPAPVDEGPTGIYLRMKDGREEAFRAVEWEMAGAFLKATYYPERRGEIGTYYFALSDIARLQIEEPEFLAKKREVQPPAPAWTNPTPAIPQPPYVVTTNAQAPAPQGPQMYVARAGENVGQRLPAKGGIVPQSLVTSDTDDRTPTVVEATMY